MDVHAWIVSTSSSHPHPGQDNIVIDNSDGRLIHSDEAIERVLHAAIDANYHRLLADGYKGSGRSSSTSSSSSPSSSPSSSSSSSSTSVISEPSPSRLLFTSRHERGAQSNPLDDARYILADYRAGLSEAWTGVEAEATDASATATAADEDDVTCSDIDDVDDDDDDNASYVPWNQPSVLPSYLLHHNHSHNHNHNSHNHNQDSPRIIIYQTRGVYTGGTVALALLAERLSVLGYNVLLCEDPNRLSDPCAKPSRNDVGRYDAQLIGWLID